MKLTYSLLVFYILIQGVGLTAQSLVLDPTFQSHFDFRTTLGSIVGDIYENPPDGRIYVAGNFSFHNGQTPYSGSLCYNRNGSLYTSSPNTDQKVIGISLENTANANGNQSVINCNSVQNTDIGLKFSGTNEAATEVKRNLMKANYYGFVLANSGYIGDVGSSGSGADNEWEGTFGFSNTYSDNSNGNNCTLYVQNSSP
jgi:hypothetical protein